MEISWHTMNPLFRPGSVHSGSAGWDDCGRMVHHKLRVSSFPDRFTHYAWTAAWSARSDFIGSKVYACLGVNCHLHFWQNDRFFYIFFYTYHYSYMGVDAAPSGIRTRNLSITSPPLLPTSYPRCRAVTTINQIKPKTHEEATSPHDAAFIYRNQTTRHSQQ